jgi:hypothetical protein
MIASATPRLIDFSHGPSEQRCDGRHELPAFQRQRSAGGTPGRTRPAFNSQHRRQILSQSAARGNGSLDGARRSVPVRRALTPIHPSKTQPHRGPYCGRESADLFNCFCSWETTSIWHSKCRYERPGWAAVLTRANAGLLAARYRCQCCQCD